MAADQLEASLGNFHTAKQISHGQAQNQFFELQNGFSNTEVSVQIRQLEAKIRDNQMIKQFIFTIVKTSIKAELAMFYHQILCSLPKSTSN